MIRKNIVGAFVRYQHADNGSVTVVVLVDAGHEHVVELPCENMKEALKVIKKLHDSLAVDMQVIDVCNGHAMCLAKDLVCGTVTTYNAACPITCLKVVLARTKTPMTLWFDKVDTAKAALNTLFADPSCCNRI